MQQGYTHTHTHTQSSLLQNIRYSFPFITTVNTWIVHITFVLPEVQVSLITVPYILLYFS